MDAKSETINPAADETPTSLTARAPGAKLEAHRELSEAELEAVSGGVSVGRNVTKTADMPTDTQ